MEFTVLSIRYLKQKVAELRVQPPITARIRPFCHHSKDKATQISGLEDLRPWAEF